MADKTEHPMITTYRELAHKFDFYFVALAFTILGLAIQTSSLSNSCFQFWFEIVGCVLLLISGLLGLSRLEWLPMHYALLGQKDMARDKVNRDIQSLNYAGPVVKEDGTQWTRAELEQDKASYEAIIPKIDKKLDSVGAKLSIKYEIMKYSFAVGITCLVISRILLNISKLIDVVK